MRRYNVVLRILLILSTITFALTAPALVREKRQACVDVEHVPGDVITVLRKRTLMEELELLWWRNLEEMRNPAGVHLPGPAPPPGHVPPPNPGLAGVHAPDAPVPPQNPADSDRESMELDDDAPPGSPESGYSSHSPPTSPMWSTKSEDWYTAPTSPGSSTEWDSDSDRWSTISNAPSEESQAENLKAVDSELTLMKGKAKVSRRISGTAS